MVLLPIHGRVKDWSIVITSFRGRVLGLVDRYNVNPRERVGLVECYNVTPWALVGLVDCYNVTP
jgi:hypothetical protein